MSITLGVDGHKQQHTIVALNTVGHLLDERTIPNTSAGYQQAFDWACQLDPVRIWGVENSGHLSRERNIGAKRLQVELIRRDGIRLAISNIWRVFHRNKVPPLRRPPKRKATKRYSRPTPGDRI
ncbi:MAG: hypothetical protein GKR89_33700 [Candidatus Latescibacteria bacterium]|nr:hypothetical protein [Candidatus Latescibacterota bacterium]